MNKLEKTLTGVLVAGLITIGVGGIIDKDYLIYAGCGADIISIFGLSYLYDKRREKMENDKRRI